MNIRELVESKLQLITITFSNDSVYTLAVRKMGVDGADRPIFVGDCISSTGADADEQHSSCAIVFTPAGKVLAMWEGNTKQHAEAAAMLAIHSHRRGYGPSRDTMKHWTTLYGTLPHTIRGLNLEEA